MREIQVSEATEARRRVYFQLVDATDGMTPETGEAAGQPQISSNGEAWTNTGIGTLTAIGNGRYYADLTTGAVATTGTVIETRYKSANTAECPGDTVLVVPSDTTWYVATTGNDSNGGHSWDDAMLTPEYAIETAAGEGDTIHIGPGTWGLETLDNAAAVNKGDGTFGIPVTGHVFSAVTSVRIEGTTYFDGSWTIDSTTTDEIVLVGNQATLDAADAENNLDGTVTLYSASHGFSAGHHITITGTDAYDGEYTIVSKTANAFVITVEFAEESFDGAETVDRFRAETFAGTEQMANQRTITPKAGQTIIGAANTASKLYGGSVSFNTGVVSATNGRVTLEALTIHNIADGAMGVTGYNSTDLTIINCIVHGETDGLWVLGADRLTVTTSRITSTYDAMVIHGQSCLIEDSTFISTGVGEAGAEPGAVRSSLNDGDSTDCSVVFRRCYLGVELVTATDYAVSALEADGDSNFILEDCTLSVTSTHADNTGNTQGVWAKEDATVTLRNCTIITSDAGDPGGDEYDLIQEDNATLFVDPATVRYDSTKTSGTITTPVATDVAAILVDTAEIGTAGAGLTAAPWGGTVTPLSSTVSAGAVSDSNLTVYQHAALGVYVWTITDSDGDAVSLAGDTIKLQVYDPSDPATQLWSVTGTVGGDSNNQVTIDEDDTNTATAGAYRYVMRNTTDDTVIAQGVLTIVAMPEVS